MPVSTNATRNRCIMLFGAWSAAKGSKKAVITPVRSFAETPAIRNVKSRCRISPCLVGTFKQVWHATLHRLRKLFDAMFWLKLLCQIASILSRFAAANFHLQQITHAMLHAGPLSDVATTVNGIAKIATQEVKTAISPRLITVSARLNVVDSTPLAAMRAQRHAMEISHVGSAWSRAKFGAVTRVAVRNATSLAFLASKTALGLVHIAARANCHVRCPVTCFRVPNAVRCRSVVVMSVLPSAEKYVQRPDTVRSAPISR
jgi:hypothetical protein